MFWFGCFELGPPWLFHPFTISPSILISNTDTALRQKRYQKKQRTKTLTTYTGLQSKDKPTQDQDIETPQQTQYPPDLHC